MPMFLPAESRLLLEGVTIEFSDSLASSGLKFINPNAASCACSSASTGAPAPSVVSFDIASIKRA
jgi:Fe-S cluster assembly iron-binding protein IscA